MNSTIQWILVIAVYGYMGWATWSGVKAGRNGRHLSRPYYVSHSLGQINPTQMRHLHPRLKILVVDADLTCCGMWKRVMHPMAVHKLQSFMDNGWYVVLASKSNRHLANMHRVHFENDRRMVYMLKAHKNSHQFLIRVAELIDTERPEWKIGNMLRDAEAQDTVSAGLFLLVGDKLTDMGSYDATHARLTIGVLTNRQFKRFGFMYDFPWEIFPLLRRYFESKTLQAMGVKRASRNNFRKVGTR